METQNGLDFRVTWQADHAQYWQGHGIADDPPAIRCAICYEESGARGTSMYGSVHKYGPVTHDFVPLTTGYTHCATGCGETLREALDDCLDGLAQDDIEISREFEKACLAELTRQVRKESDLDMDIVQAECPKQGEHTSYNCSECSEPAIMPIEGDEVMYCSYHPQAVIDSIVSSDDCAVCAGDWHFYVSVDIRTLGEAQS